MQTRRFFPRVSTMSLTGDFVTRPRMLHGIVIANESPVELTITELKSLVVLVVCRFTRADGIVAVPDFPGKCSVPKQISRLRKAFDQVFGDRTGESVVELVGQPATYRLAVPASGIHVSRKFVEFLRSVLRCEVLAGRLQDAVGEKFAA